MKTKRQITETIYGKGAQKFAEKTRHNLFEANDDRNELDHELASPWATWTVEPVNGGWAVFVEEER